MVFDFKNGNPECQRSHSMHSYLYWNNGICWPLVLVLKFLSYANCYYGNCYECNFSVIDEKGFENFFR